MDEFISLILHGIQLAKDLEPNLQNLATHQDMHSKLDEVIRIFHSAKEKLNSLDPTLYHQMLLQHQLQIDPQSLHLQDHQFWSRTNINKPMELFQTLDRKASTSSSVDHILSAGGGLAIELGGPSNLHPMPSTSLQRPRRRKDDAEKRTMTVPAPRMGNTEVPPEDGYTWRKYGQKEILGCKHPRGYYRCTHQKLYHCPAKKQVQRRDDDPFTFEVTYRGKHICHMSATAPSIPPPPPEITQQTLAAHHPPPWLEFSLGAGGGGSGGSGAGPSTSTVRYGKEAEFPVADLADVMFNSGSSSSNSMELIFNAMEDKWERGDKKN